jgi:hypothetical protein
MYICFIEHTGRGGSISTSIWQCYGSVICMFLGLLEPDPLVTGADPDPSIKQN